MNAKTIIAKIEERTAILDQIDAEVRRRAEREAEIMAPIQSQIEALMVTVQSQLDTLNASHIEVVDALQAVADGLKEEVDDAVVLYGDTVRGSKLMVVYNRPSVKWDGAKLDGYAEAHPEIKAFRSAGEAHVSWRTIK